MIRTTTSFNFVIYDIPYSVDYFMRIEGDHIFFSRVEIMSSSSSKKNDNNNRRI